MKILRTAGLSLLFLAIVLTLATCGKRSSPAKPALGPSGPQLSASSQSAAPAQPQAVFTEEDFRLMAMPYQERLDYLEQKLKDLVYKMYGISIEETMLGSKSASGAGVPATSRKEHGVQKPLEYTNENLSFEWFEDENTREWRLSFWERLNGDLNLDSKVAIDDITALAIHYGCERVEEPPPPHWEPPGFPKAPHVDRNSTSDGIF